MKKSFTGLILFSLLASIATANAGNPDISAVGGFSLTSQDEEVSTSAGDLRLNISQEIDGGARVKAVAHLSENGGNTTTSLNELNLDVDDVFGTLNLPVNLQLEGTLGKQRLNFGQLNQKYFDELSFATKGLVYNQFVSPAGLTADGLSLRYNTAMPVFSSVELGTYQVESAGGSQLAYNNKVLNLRVNGEFQLTNGNDLAYGVSYLINDISADESDDKDSVLGLDVSYKSDMGLMVNAEYMMADYTNTSANSKGTQSGGYVSGIYKLNDTYAVGASYHFLGKFDDLGDTSDSIRIMGSSKLNDDTTLTLQYTTASTDQEEDSITARVIFGIGTR